MLNYRNVIGVMSGTSTDGLDIACCNFIQRNNDHWNFEIVNAQTIDYTDDWSQTLSNAHKLDAFSLLQLNEKYGFYIGQNINAFMKKYNLKASLIGSHGHTVFHQPKAKLTYQIGSGKALALSTSVPTVSEFRNEDVLKGGQGAPLAPVGDYYLFNDYMFRVNLGGFANISYEKYGKMIAYDICPANLLLNPMAEKLNKPYDGEGAFAKSGKINKQLLNVLNNLEYYDKEPPKSLGREWLEETLKRINKRMDKKPANNLATYTEHIADQVAKAVSKVKGYEKVLLTGGGAKNNYLVTRIREKTHHTIIVPEQQIIDYKESVIFAFLAVLNKENIKNVWSSVTGAYEDSCSGTFYK
ncbi:MAG: anhydro-N-acetylmuramic acid kinase [Bacteroidales bacterium]|nr:anhydro-N-acetylmuramic acid kinase [Bacteroidales bacterium]